MNTKYKIRPRLAVIGAVLCTAIIGLSATSALADASPQSFQTTNQLATGAVFTTLPTNAPGAATGLPIDLKNYKTTGFYVTGNIFNSSNAAGSALIIKLPRNPKVAGSTTNFWETTPQFTLTVPLPVGTNTPFSWMTNFPEDFAAAAVSVGISSISNNLTSGTLSNADIGLIKKTVPITYP